MAREKWEPSKVPSPKKPKGANYLKYSGLAFQIVLTILLLGYFGQYLDNRMNSERPYMTLLWACIGLVASLIYLIKRVGKGL